jgi:hypothetical protein
MGHFGNSVFDLAISHALPSTHTCSAASTGTYTLADAGTTSAASIRAFRDKLSGRPGLVIRGNLH